MGLFSRRDRNTNGSAAAPTSSTPAAPIELPLALNVSSQEEAGVLLEEVGQIQQAISNNWRSAEGAELEILPRVEGVLLYMLPTATYPAQVFEVLVAPLSEWSMQQLATHPDFVNNPRSQELQARMRLMNYCSEYRKKYQYLNPDNA